MFDEQASANWSKAYPSEEARPWAKGVGPMGRPAAAEPISAKAQGNVKGGGRLRINATSLQWDPSGNRGAEAIKLPATFEMGKQSYSGTIFIRTGSPPFLHVSSPLCDGQGGVTTDAALRAAGISNGDNLELWLTVEVRLANRRGS
jgi:hypothetical protein